MRNKSTKKEKKNQKMQLQRQKTNAGREIDYSIFFFYFRLGFPGKLATMSISLGLHVFKTVYSSHRQGEEENMWFSFFCYEKKRRQILIKMRRTIFNSDNIKTVLQNSLKKKKKKQTGPKSQSIKKQMIFLIMVIV